MLCGRLHAGLLTQPRLIAMLHSLIAQRWVWPQTQWRPGHKAFTSGFGLDAMSLAWPTVVQLVVSFNSGLQWGMSQEYSFFVSSVIDLILCFCCDALTELGSFYANRTFYVFFVLRIISGPRVKFVQWKALLLFLFCVALWFNLRGPSCLVLPCSLSMCFFYPFSILITLLGEEGADLCAYCAFVW